MKLLILNIYFYPDATGTGLVITELAQDLVAQGHEVTVITSAPHYGGVRKDSPADELEVVITDEPTPNEQPGHRAEQRSSISIGRRRHLPVLTPRLPPLWRRSWLDGIQVIRTAVYLPRRQTLWSRALNYASYALLAILAGWRSGRQELIFCTSPPLPLGLSAWLLSRLKRVPFVFNVQDIYPDCAVLMGMVRNRLLIELFRRMERFIYRRASLVTVISEGAKRNLCGKGVSETKIAVVPNWVDVEYVRPVPVDNEFRRSLDLSENYLVMFAGNIGLIAGLESVLEAAAHLRSRSDIHFLLVGEGNAKKALMARARQMSLSNVTFLPTQPRERLDQVLGAADLHLVTLKRQMSTTSVPSKSYGIMASGRPMVAAVDPGSEIWRLVEAADAGVCVPPEEPQELARAVVSLCDDADRRKALGANGRAYVVRHSDKRQLTTRYGLLLERLADGRGERDPFAQPIASLAGLPRTPAEEAGPE